MRLALALLLAGVAIAAAAALLYCGVRLARKIEKKAPAEMRAQVTRTGLALYACMTAVLLVFAAAATLQPEGPLGSFIRRADGLAAALIAIVAFFSLMAWLFEKVGYPIVRRSESRTSPRR